MQKLCIALAVVCCFLLAWVGWQHYHQPKVIPLNPVTAAYLRGPYTAPHLGFPDSREYLKHFRTVQYRGTPKVPASGIVSIHYKDLYPGDLNWRDGGCTWWDKTKLGSRFDVAYSSDEETVKAIPGHVLEYECHWSAPRKVQ
jgi:hypothetical protein